jgi:hypothetical protein
MIKLSERTRRSLVDAFGIPGTLGALTLLLLVVIETLEKSV